MRDDRARLGGALASANVSPLRRYARRRWPRSPIRSISERLRLSSGEGRRLELTVAPRALRARRASATAVDPAPVPVRLDVSRTTGAGYALRLRFAAASARAVHALPRARGARVRGRRPRDLPAGGGGGAATRHTSATACSISRPGRATRWPSPCRRPSSADRIAPASAPCAGRPERRRPRHAPRARPGPALGQALRAAFRLTRRSRAGAPASLRPAMAVPKQKQSHSRTTKRRSQHKLAHARLQRLPDLPQPAAAAPRLPDLRLLQGPRGRRHDGAPAG